MAFINITNIVFDQNTTLFNTPIQMQITFDVLRQLDQEIDWKLIYIGSPNNDKHDQVIEQFSMSPLKQGTMQFTLISACPRLELIPSKEDLFGATAIILTVRYRNQEFFRVGYYVYNSYMDPDLIENDPQYVIIDKVYRQIDTQTPRITRTNIDWEGQMVQLYINPLQSNNQFMFQQNIIYNDINNQEQQQQQSQEIYNKQQQYLDQPTKQLYNNNQSTSLLSIF